jgi:hypothetical protein
MKVSRTLRKPAASRGSDQPASTISLPICKFRFRPVPQPGGSELCSKIGNHRLICSDSTKRDMYRRLVVIEVRPQTDLFGPMG